MMSLVLFTPAGMQHTERTTPMRTTLAAIAATLLLASAAWAQSPPSNASHPSPSGSGQSMTQPQQPVREQIEKNLKAAGFTDIKLMASSFLVRAKDRDGNPVMMVINPDSVTAVVEGQSTPNQSSTTGSGSPHQGSTTGSATPNQNSNPAHR
jgi:hypothetical protein